jgi:hypothetical protein
MGIEEEVQDKGQKTYNNKIIAENFPNLGKEMLIQVQEAFRTPCRQNKKSTSLRHIIVLYYTKQGENIEREKILK